MSYIIEKSRYPKEIIFFLDSIFEIYEIRGKVGQVNGIKFEIRTNEQNHALPHIHAQYGEFNISIEIESGRILAGNLPKKNEQLAVDWVVRNRDKLMEDWKNIAISSVSMLTKSRLSQSRWE